MRRLPLLVLVLAVTAIARCVATQTVLRSWAFGLTAIGDVDGDGKRDLLRLIGSQFSVYSSFTGALLAQHTLTSAVNPWLLGNAGDVDGDGRDDVFFHCWNPTQSEIRVVSAFTGAALYTYLTSPIGGHAARLSDLNGDGKAEFARGDATAIVNGMANAGRLDIVDGATGAILRQTFGTAAEEQHGRVHGVGDLNGDGHLDYVLQRPSNTATAFSGATGNALYTVPGYFLGHGVNDLGDVDGDGRDDFTHSYSASGKGWAFAGWHIVSGATGSAIWNYSIPFSGYAYWNLQGIGDIDNDGHADLLFRGSLYDLTIGNTVVSGRDRITRLFEFPQSLGIFFASPGDVDDDGILDLLSSPANGASTQLRSGQAPGVLSLGQPCPSSTGTAPKIGVSIGARLNRNFTINLSCASPHSVVAVLGLGYDNTSWNGVPLPIDMGSIGWNGCFWRVAPVTQPEATLVPLGGQLQAAQHWEYVPGYPGLLGLDIYSQWAVFELSPRGPIGSVTRAVRTRIVP